MLTFRKGILTERRSVGSASPRRPALNLAPIKSNPEELAKLTDSRNLPRSLTGSKPPRLDTSKLALLAPKQSQEFSPLSANASDRAKSYLDLALVLYNGNYLHVIYHGWILGQGVTSIRNSCRALFGKIKQLEQARLETDGINLSNNAEITGNQEKLENSMDGQLVDPTETNFASGKLTKKSGIQDDKFKFLRQQAYNTKNAKLNRYADIAPFDRNRVILSTKPNDYINASFMKSMDGQRNYIATQGPLQSTLGDFWQMTWDQKSGVIVMLTQTEESTRVKSHKYWPDNVGDTKRYHKSVGNNSVCFQVFYADELQMMNGTTVIRELVVKREMLLKGVDDDVVEIRLIRIIHYLAWSDYDSCDARSLLSLIDVVNEVNRQAAHDIVVKRDSSDPYEIGPKIINCSAGVGRTGTFCTADSVLAMLTNPLPILSEVDQRDWDELPPDDIIARTVNHFRTQRCGFVQTSAQFELLYDAVLLKLGDLFDAKVEAKWPRVPVKKIS